MMKVPVENLGLFEQLDRIVVAFFRKQQPSSPYDLNVSITQEHLDQKKQLLYDLTVQIDQDFQLELSSLNTILFFFRFSLYSTLIILEYQEKRLFIY